MPPHTNTAPVTPNALASKDRSDWATLKTLIPYLMAYRLRVAFALACLLMAKLANVTVPVSLKGIVDQLTAPGAAGGAIVTALVVPISLVIAYGLLRMSATLFTELRELVFARVTQSAVREIEIGRASCRERVLMPV